MSEGGDLRLRVVLAEDEVLLREGLSGLLERFGYNDVPALIVASTGDTRTVYRGGRALHRQMTGSRLLTLSGARIHAVYPRYDDTCVNETINAYLRTGILPAKDATCESQG
jgi:hypothetical protein